jgi:hypothetical protein
MPDQAQGQNAPAPAAAGKGKFTMANVLNKVQGNAPPATVTPADPVTPVTPVTPATPAQATPPVQQVAQDMGLEIPLSLLGIQDAPPPPPQAPTAPVVDQDANIDTSNWATQQREAFIRGRQREAEMKREMAQMKEQLSKVQQTPAMPVNPFEDPAVKARLQEAETYKQRAEKLENEMAKVNVQYDPRFKAEFEIPREEKILLAESYLKAYGKDREFAESLESLGIKDRIEAINKDAPQLLAAILPILSDLDALKSKKNQVLNSAKDMQSQYATQREEQIKQMKAQHYASAVKSLQASGHFMYMDEGDLGKHAPALVPMARKIRESATAILNSNDPAIATKAMLMAAETPFLHQQLREQSKLIAKLKSDLSKFGTLSPTSGGSQTSVNGTVTPPGAKTQANQGKSFMERQVAAAQSSVASR